MIELSVGSLSIASATIRNAETNGIFRMKDWGIERSKTAAPIEAEHEQVANRSRAMPAQATSRLDTNDANEFPRHELPPPTTKRWVARRKAAVVAAVLAGVITVEEACRRYQLSEEEL